MRLFLLTSLALLVAAPAQAVLAPAHVGQATYTGNPAGHGMRAVELAGGSVVAGLGHAPRGVEPAVGLSFGDSALPSSPADGHLLGTGSWASWGSSASDQRADVPPGGHHHPAHSAAGYGSTVAEPAGWAVAAAALLTLLGLLGLRRRAR